MIEIDIPKNNSSMFLTERYNKPNQLYGLINQILLLLSFFLVFPGLQAQNPGYKIRDIINKVNIDTLSSHVRYLSGEDSVRINSAKYLITSRKSGTTTNLLARDYIKSKLSGYGLQAVEQCFTTTVSGCNIYAVQPGRDTGSIYIVCAHYDAVREFAADDNATGVAAVLEAARLLSPCILEHTVIYGFWDQEETGLHGSRYFAGLYAANHRNIQGVINLDMLGWDGNADGKAEIHTRNYANSAEMASNLEKLNTSFTTGIIPSVFNPGSTSSDHSSFWNYNYPAILLIEAYKGGDFNPYYHTILDRFNSLNLPYFHGMAKLAIAGITSYVMTNTSALTVDLQAGWNIFSTNVLPDSLDMTFLFRTLIDNGTLIKVQDESGNSLEDYGGLGGWKNNIGKISLTEGYKIKVSGDCQLIMGGTPVSLPLKISLNTGWNIIGFPNASEVDGLEVVQQLVDRGTLVKVQDEKGNSIEDWGVFGGWVNNTGNFKPGEGYKIKVNAKDTITIYEFYPKSMGLNISGQAKPMRFLPVIKGNGVDHMNINLVNLPAGQMQAGDEIAVFDGAFCVGAVTLLPLHLSNGRVSIPVSASDGDGISGFTEGNRFSLKYWNASKGIEYPLEPEIIKGVPTFLKNETTFASLGKFATGLEDISELNDEITIYPNPTYGKITLRAGNKSLKGCNVEVMNSIGQLVSKVLLKTNPGILDLSGNTAGIYYIKVTQDMGTHTRKIVVR
jgi:hypothetical protein